MLAGAHAWWRSLPPNQYRQDCREDVANLGAQQLLAVNIVMDCLTHSRGQPGGALAAFGSQVAVPEAFLPWLATVTEALMLLPKQQQLDPGRSNQPKFPYHPSTRL